MYDKNNKGPQIYPCETPHSTKGEAENNTNTD